MSYRTFHRYAIEDIERIIASMSVRRKITNIQIHHTASPTLNGYKLAKDKHAVIKSMWTFHTVSRGFRDIAQHYTVAPDGIWDGRDIEWDSGGFKGSENIGGICIEIIGFYDKGKEAFEGTIAEYAFRLVAALMKQFPGAEIRFHREQASANGKTCPGTAIDKAWFVSEVQKRMVTQTPLDTINAFMASNGQTTFSKEYWDTNAVKDGVCKGEYVASLLSRIATAIRLNK